MPDTHFFQTVKPISGRASITSCVRVETTMPSVQVVEHGMAALAIEMLGFGCRRDSHLICG